MHLRIFWKWTIGMLAAACILPSALAQQPPGRGPGGGTPPMVQDFIQKLATVHATPSAKPQILEQMKNWMSQHGGTDVDSKLAGISKIFDQAVAMSAADFQKSQQDLAWQIFRQMRGPPPGRAGTTTSPGAGTQPGQLTRRGPAQLPPGTSVQRDLEYVAGGGNSRSLDLYVPEHAAGALPVVVWIHGGGWRSGSKDMVPALTLLSRGYAIASLNYRLSGEAPWPAQLDDCKAAIRWLRANAPRQHLDHNHIGVWGSSSGGHLVAMLGVTGDQESRVQAVCDCSGTHDLVALFDLQVPGENGKTAYPIQELLGGRGVATKAKAAQASPLTHVSRDAAPFLLMHGDRDQLIPIQQSELFDAALRKAGAECKFVVVPGAGHGFGGAEIDNQVAEFFDLHLKSGGGPATAPDQGTVPSRQVDQTQIKWIDVHNHIYPNHGSREFTESVRTALAQMDQVGIGKMVLMPPPGGFCPDLTFLKACPQACGANRSRFGFGAGNDLNDMIENKVADKTPRTFEQKANALVDQGACVFGEIFIMHLLIPGMEYGVPADHPLLLLLADISARRDVPMDVHFDLIAEDHPGPDHVSADKVRQFPQFFHNNLPAFERLLAHNPKSKIIWEHVGGDPFGYCTPALCRQLLQKYPNLYLSMRLGICKPPENTPMASPREIRPEWLRLFQDFPDRFMIGRDGFLKPDSKPETGGAYFWTRKLLDILPPDVARKIAYENAATLFKLKP